MTSRHPERLDSDEENGLDFSSDEDTPLAVPLPLLPPGPPAAVPPQLPNLNLHPNVNANINANLMPTAPPPPPAPAFNTALPSIAGFNLPSRGWRNTSLATILDIPAPHLLQTDFSEETLNAFLREQVENINRTREAVKGKAKGKQKETAAAPSVGLPLMPSAPPLSDQSNRSHGSAGLATPSRRSVRLSHKFSSSRSSLNPLAAPFVPNSTEQVPPQSADSQSTRSSTFEEFTKNKRHAVRNNAQESSGGASRTKPRHTRSSNPTSSSPAGSSSRILSDLTLQEDSPQQTAQSSSTGFFGRAAGALLSRRVGGKLSRSFGFSPSSGDVAADLPVQHLPQSFPADVSGFLIEVDEDEDRYSSQTSMKYAKLIPESIPQADKKAFFGSVNRAKRTQSAEPEPESQPSTGRSRSRLHAKMKKKEELMMPESRSYPHMWKPSPAHPIPVTPPEPADSLSPKSNTVPETGSLAIWELDEILWTAVCQFLSSQDVKNLRLVCKSLVQTLSLVQLRNVVVNFDKNFFNTSMFKDYGANFNQFGISFEYDLRGLATARPKVIEKLQDAWFGNYTWPTENYPRFPELQAIEDLVDNNRPLLKEFLAQIPHASELGLCIDSGHGWLEGGDMSDLALLDKRSGKGSKVFGKTFKTEDFWTAFARNEYFRWAQQNTINATTKSILARSPAKDSDVKEVRFLDALIVRDIESFRSQDQQYDYDTECHTGGLPSVDDVAPAAQVNPQVNPLGAAVQNLVNNNANANATPTLAERHRRRIEQSRNANRKQPQWPVIFNCYNVAAEHGGHLSTVQHKIAHPSACAIAPGLLTEAQAQWLMETVWAQRAFLSAYTTAIILHKNNFRNIHTLRISKLSSGLLPSLEQREFWKTLSGLGKLEIYLSPDWRQEHVTGDKSFAQNMLIPPAKAAERFTDFLRRYVTKIESLHTLTVGYVGGGEHAVGIFARNQHVLPAPIVDDPDEWLLEDRVKYAPALTKFDHVRNLKFENCWVTPWILKGFMEGSRDTSLHSLTLDSVSMTTIHVDSLEAHLTTHKDNLRCEHSEQEWPLETLPGGAAWVRALDAITPGKRLHEFKHEAGLTKEEDAPKPERHFRGHIQEITLNSCGYVKVSLPKGRSSTYNQNSAVVHSEGPMDGGIRARKARFNGLGAASSEAGRIRDHLSRFLDHHERTSRVMLQTEGLAWLGTLTQCIHPIEKRVLEQAWKMKFGWINDLRRWGAVEDGMWEGGTGRFSGVIKKDDDAAKATP
ncbi:hypothetical protein H2200_009702 [Cladophialophora chaetospira]|uniref:F-box domain-containing protein n=1 Tax=Cladophialophora chaetospira TaxID=386627 RepID=A0AA38X2W8_9EURO|nr:hypothetical protein H2200_009702 [Cladophialophora chaetospira]